VLYNLLGKKNGKGKSVLDTVISKAYLKTLTSSPKWFALKAKRDDDRHRRQLSMSLRQSISKRGDKVPVCPQDCSRREGGLNLVRKSVPGGKKKMLSREKKGEIQRPAKLKMSRELKSTKPEHRSTREIPLPRKTLPGGGTSEKKDRVPTDPQEERVGRITPLGSLPSEGSSG